MCPVVEGVTPRYDYLAEMYDPHPDAPGPWFRAHFHRLFELDGDDEPCYYAQYLKERSEKLELLAKCPIS